MWSFPPAAPASEKPRERPIGPTGTPPASRRDASWTATLAVAGRRATPIRAQSRLLTTACEGECDCEDETDGDYEPEAPEDAEVEIQIHDALVGWLERAIRFEKSHHRLRPIVDFELPIDRRQVEFHGMDRDA